MTQDAAIVARGLTRRFGRLVAVNGVDLTIPRARIFGFLGPNGSGKSTTIRMLCGLLEPSAGTVDVLGHRMPQQAEELRSKLGYMTQRFSLWDDLTVRENLEFVARVFGLTAAERRQRIAARAEEYGLGPIIDQRAGTLSGGQRQRLALASATLHEPELLLLDEPTSALDASVQAETLNLLNRLRAERGLTFLMVSHDLAVIDHMCDRVLVMQHGRAVEELARADLAAARMTTAYARTLFEASADRMLDGA